MFPVRHIQQRVHLTPPSNFSTTARQQAHWQPCSIDNVHKQFWAYVELLKREGIATTIGEPAPVHNPDAIYAYDSCLCLPAGAIVLQSIKQNRQREIDLVRSDLKRLHIPVLGEILHPAHIDGGDILWLTESEVAVGRGWRTNDLAIAQLQHLLQPFSITVRRYDLSNLLGQEHCLHLMSVISMLDDHTALVYERGMPIALLQRLAELNIRTTPVAEQEWLSLGCNVLALGEKRVIALAGNPITCTRMEAAGFRVLPLNAADLCLAGEGGPTCLTRLLPFPA